MQACTLIARAKINLYLEILGSRPDGYSEVAMVLQSIHLADRLQLKSRPHGIHLTCDRPEVPADARNLAYQAAELLQKECHSAAGVEIHIEKHIPVAAGLAGGSADAAAVLVGLNQLWGLGLTVGELQSLAARLGSDIPFCIQGERNWPPGAGKFWSRWPIGKGSLCYWPSPSTWGFRLPGPIKPFVLVRGAWEGMPYPNPHCPPCRRRWRLSAVRIRRR
jgi:4-diphosphocytidyl-2-C-methyl-D-erythritol kinase